MSLFDELRRRNVFRVAIAYVVVAWLVAQVLELILDSFGNETAGIRGIMRLTAEQADDLLIRHGKKEPPEQQDPTPPELEGAEVEELGEIG